MVTITSSKKSEAISFMDKQGNKLYEQPLGLRGAQKIIEETLPKAGLTNKHCRLYMLRHSRATHLANHLTEAQMCIFFGWQHGMKVVRCYIHISGKAVDNAFFALNEGIGQPGIEQRRRQHLSFLLFLLIFIFFLFFCSLVLSINNNIADYTTSILALVSFRPCSNSFEIVPEE
jgi:hypothetical protein